MSEKAYSGRDLETGVLQRVRQWRDALPLLVLPSALRVAGSPSYVLVVLSVVLLTRLILGTMDATIIVPDTGPAGADAEDVALGRVFRPLAIGLSFVTDFGWLQRLGWPDLLRLMAVIVLWAGPAATIARAGACYAAKRDQTFSDNTAVAWRRLPWIWLTALVPPLCVLVLCGVMLVVGLLGRLGRVGVWLSELGALLALPAVVFIGMLAAGAIVAVPLAWAAMVIEKRCDTLDSLSRGYEYLYRRPVQLVLYSICCYALIMIIFALAQAVSSAALVLGTLASELGSGSASVPYWFQIVLGYLPVAVAATALWGLVGAVYLLMRLSANDQEIEDIAISPADRREPVLPTLSTAAADSAS